MKVSKAVLVALGALAGAAPAGPSFAHHSYAMFDSTKSVTLQGTVKALQWTNPHTWVQLIVRDATGKDVEYSIEGGSPNGLARQGWKRTSLKPGDKATAIIHPLKDGAAGGSLVEIAVNGVRVGN